MSVQTLTIPASHAEQRIDNYLITKLKGVPRSRIYRALRSGEIRINGGRIKPNYRLQENDLMRLPPLRVAAPTEILAPSQKWQVEIEKRILFEDTDCLIMDKPAGIPVHGGTDVSWGLIEAIRAMRPRLDFLELAHRLDKGTSGCLFLAKKRQVLLEFNQLLADRKVKKKYLALVQGTWQGGEKTVNVPLIKNHLQSGERVVKVNNEGREAVTVFHPLRRFAKATLVTASPLTGRTHQIRVHAAHIGHPIAGDAKYGDENFNQYIKKLGADRLFLHSAQICCDLPLRQKKIGMCVRPDDEFLNVLGKLRKSET